MGGYGPVLKIRLKESGDKSGVGYVFEREDLGSDQRIQSNWKMKWECGGYQELCFEHVRFKMLDRPLGGEVM